jgi:hypothetical protein
MSKVKLLSVIVVLIVGVLLIEIFLQNILGN